MRRYDVGSALFLLLFGLLAVTGSRRLTVGTFRQPGAGFFPELLGILLSLVSLGLVARALWVTPAGPQEESEPPRTQWRRIVLPLALLVAYALLLETVGFPLLSTLLMLCLFRGVDPLPWPAAIGGSIVAGVGSYLVFKVLLAVQLPAGPLPF